MADDVYKDEKIDFSSMKVSGDDSSKDHRWDYVAPAQVRTHIPWQVSYKLNNIEEAPEKIQQLFKMFEGDAWNITRNKAFYEQALFMKDYEDHADIVPFQSYFPVYRDMTVMQLRSYFAIRTMLRQGKYPEVPLSYLFIYIYELLMKIGIDTPEEGLELLEELREAYKTSYPRILNYLDPWLQDYIIYNNLSNAIEKYFKHQIADDKQAMVLSNFAKLSDGLLMDTICQLSCYKIKDAALYKKEPATVTSAVARVVRVLIPVIEKREHHHIDSICFGMKKKKSRAMFSTAVFYDPNPVKNATIDISARRKAYCNNGLWTYDTYVQNAYNGKKGEPFGTILHEIDRQLRLLLGKGPKIRPKMQDVEMKRLIHEAIGEWMREKAEAERPKIHVDFTKLDKIREDAKVVRDALLIDTLSEGEETTAENIKDKDISRPVSSSSKKETATEETPAEKTSTSKSEPKIFTDEEIKFLRLLLDDGDYQTFLREIHIPAGVMTENINNKMMDEIGDIAIDDDGTGLSVIEDYINDINKLIR